MMSTRDTLCCGLALMLLAGTLAAGCNVEDDPERESKDSERTSALEMPINKVIIDNVDFFGGDRTDWKYYTLPSDGLCKVVINFDDESASPEIEVINSVGQVLSNLDLPESSEFLRQLSFRATPGNYYLHIFVEEGSTDYSVEVTFTPGG